MANGTPLRDSDRLNLEKAVVLIVDDNPQALDILGQVLSGFGVKLLHRCSGGQSAMDFIRSHRVDLVITDANMPEVDGWTLVRWIRTEAGEANRYVPVIVCTGYTRLGQILRSRDCGANFVIAKPITPRIILERIFWVAGDERSFIECETYTGPDRRFRHVGPPADQDGRRKDDMPARPSEPAGERGGEVKEVL
jgi:CheY-like chemotaxis protein